MVRTHQFFLTILCDQLLLDDDDDDDDDDVVHIRNRALALVSCTFCRAHLQKVARDHQFFTILC